MNDIKNNYFNPDVLNCIANLSSDEVFTPPTIANAMLDLLPQELWKDRNAKFLDPFTKSGVFLREITKRLLEAQMPNYLNSLQQIEDKKKDGKALRQKEHEFINSLQENIDYILHNQVYGIAITELTSLLSRRSLYCSKYPNCKYSISKFDDAEGNIRFKRVEHTWKNGKCIFCGASQSEYDRDKNLETHAYEFIHVNEPKEIYNMKFDVIIGNPPYALDTAGAGRQATPLYNVFVEQAKKLNPKYLTMIIPSRWFSGGMELDKFRINMQNDTHISKLVDYTNSKDCFPGISVSGGVCFFLWERDYSGECEFTNITNGKKITAKRPLNEFETLVRYNEAVSIIHKITLLKEQKLQTIISPLMPFGLSTSYRGKANQDELVLYASDGTSFIKRSEIKSGHNLIDKYKVLISKTGAEHAGEPGKDGKFRIIPTSMKVLKPNEVCTHSYFLVGAFENEFEANNCYSYLATKFTRFLLLMCLTGYALSKNTFVFVPIQDFSKPWTDEELYQKYNLTQEEIDFIESMIKPMDLSTGDDGDE